MIHPIAAFLKLPRRDRAVVMRACALFPVAGLGVRTSGLRRTQTLLRALAGRETLRSAADTADDAVANAVNAAANKARRITHLVEQTASHLRPQPLCLARSLVLEALLRRAGYAAVLRIGARRAKAFEAHAWVELGGAPLNESADVIAQFAAFDDTTRAVTPPSD